jgi:NADH-quinone oxidoreductase subunit L
VEHGGVPAREHPHSELAHDPHESPGSMVLPLVILAVCSVLLGFVGTPVWPWFQRFIEQEQLAGGFSALTEHGVLTTMLISTAVVAIGIGLGWFLYGRGRACRAEDLDPLERMRPDIFSLLRNKYYIDEVYELTFVRLNACWGWFSDLLDFWVWNGAVKLVAYLVVGLAWIDRVLDEQVVNRGFDAGCDGVREGGGLLSRLEDGRVQHYLRVIGVALAVLVLFLIWGCHAS